jgi:hypothetical protein
VRFSPHTAPIRQTSRSSAADCSYRSTSSCCQLCRTYDCLTRPLRSSTITEPSSLLQVGPPQAIASVLSPRGFLPLCFSLSIDGLVPAVPHKSLCRTHAPYTPAAARPVIRLLTGLSQKTASPLVSTAPDKLTTRLRRVCFHSSFRHSPVPGLARDFSPDAHHHGSLPQQLGLV